MGIRLSILSIWKIVDPIYFLFTRLQYIESSANKKAIFRVRLTKYKGKDVILSDGTTICKNDVLLKIHIHNVKLLSELLRMENHVIRARYLYKMVLNSMPLLAEYIHNHPEEQKIKGVIGITMINKGVRQLGFECFSPQNIFYKICKKTSLLPIFFLSTSSFSFSNVKKHHLVYLMMSKEKLLKKYRKAT
ncbi:hypothetical protein PB1_11124 [Bacillus methanolicus PB1]|uniref:YkoP-like domain-containing protein n=1 Tax=Bacillus methanolicus PB1 TaxID=997296 RepID=I3DV36_BACMT|nr:hypothetical protein [Bacillus methanolicus]EIJ78107.1 hypothetical protein PB1_11124 [Bacillus methanolicus PB1]